MIRFPIDCPSDCPHLRWWDIWWDSPMFNIQCNSKMKRMRERLSDGNDCISGK